MSDQVLSLAAGAFLAWALIALMYHLSWRRRFREFDPVTFWASVGFATLFVGCIVLALVSS